MGVIFRKITSELRKLMEQGLFIIEEKLLLTEHSHIQYTQYRESSQKLVKLCDLIDIFTSVNEKLI